MADMPGSPISYKERPPMNSISLYKDRADSLGKDNPGKSHFEAIVVFQGQQSATGYLESVALTEMTQNALRSIEN